MSHERCPRRPGQRQAPDGRCQVVSIKAVPGGWGAAVAGLGVCWERAGADANGPLGLWILVFPSFRLPSASRCLK